VAENPDKILSLVFMADSHSIGSPLKAAFSLICSCTQEYSRGIQSTIKSSLSLLIFPEIYTHVLGHDSASPKFNQGFDGGGE